MGADCEEGGRQVRGAETPGRFGLCVRNSRLGSWKEQVPRWSCGQRFRVSEGGEIKQSKWAGLRDHQGEIARRVSWRTMAVLSGGGVSMKREPALFSTYNFHSEGFIPGECSDLRAQTVAHQGIVYSFERLDMMANCPA